jgi:hypothetical protein
VRLQRSYKRFGDPVDKRRCAHALRRERAASPSRSSLYNALAWCRRDLCADQQLRIDEGTCGAIVNAQQHNPAVTIVANAND